ncbi:hypothetical protein BDN72DRAFT_881176 [Pluteus cervinus]|uniref:Uncharacterized protein n=1 Tax=Pluteus cervinus TaxID=181527 RepID=A0ACD3AH23_9AGAR|nr:hypothetical protein BDN72DRAFT_881176 [Pluteus cervinus]
MAAYGEFDGWGIDNTGAFLPLEREQEIPFSLFQKEWDGGDDDRTRKTIDWVDELATDLSVGTVSQEARMWAQDPFVSEGDIASTPGMGYSLLRGYDPWQMSVQAPSPKVNTYTPTTSAGGIIPSESTQDTIWMNTPAVSHVGDATSDTSRSSNDDPISEGSGEIDIDEPPQASSSQQGHTAGARRHTPKNERHARTRARQPAAPPTEQEREAAEILASALFSRRTNKWHCPTCNKGARRKPDLGRHIQSHLHKLRMKCPVCDEDYSRKDGLKRHQKRSPGCKPEEGL